MPNPSSLPSGLDLANKLAELRDQETAARQALADIVTERETVEAQLTALKPSGDAKRAKPARLVEVSAAREEAPRIEQVLAFVKGRGKQKTSLDLLRQQPFAVGVAPTAISRDLWMLKERKQVKHVGPGQYQGR